MLSILTEPPHNIAASSLSKLRNDIDGLKRAWETALSTLSFFSAPAFAILAVIGQDFVVLLLGQKWAPAGPLLCIFAVRGIAHSIERTMGWLHVAVGRADRWMRWGVYSAFVQLMALAAGLPFGVTGVAVAYAIAMFGLFVPALVYSGRPIGIRTRDVLQAVGPQMTAGLVAVAGRLPACSLSFLQSPRTCRGCSFPEWSALRPISRRGRASSGSPAPLQLDFLGATRSVRGFGCRPVCGPRESVNRCSLSNDFLSGSTVGRGARPSVRRWAFAFRRSFALLSGGR